MGAATEGDPVEEVIVGNPMLDPVSAEAVVRDPVEEAVVGDTAGNQIGIIPPETKIDHFGSLNWDHCGVVGDGE